MIDLCTQIYYKATGKDELVFLEEISAFTPQVQEAIQELEHLRRRTILNQEYTKVEITEETKKYIQAHPEKFAYCGVRIRTGKIYTDKEYEEMVIKALERTLPDEEGPVLKRK